MDKRIYVLIVVSILVLAGLVGFADLDELKLILGQADGFMVVLAFASYTLAIAVFALIWHLLLRATNLKLGFIDNLKLVFSSVFFNVVTPTASYGGEAVRGYLLSKKFNQDTGKGAATIVAHRIIGTLSNSFGTLILGIYLIISFEIATILVAVIVAVTLSSFIGFLVVLYFGLRLEWSKKVVERLFGLISRIKKIEEDTKKSVFNTLTSYHEGLDVLLSQKNTLFFSFVLGLIAWFFVNIVAIFAFKAVGGVVNIENFLLIFTFFSVSRLIPTGLPEFVGSKEAILAGLYATTGLPISTSVAVIIIIRAATQVWMILLGGAVTLQLGLSDIKRDLK